MSGTQTSTAGPRILVVGASGVGKSVLVQRVTGARPVAPHCTTPWLIDTKYYTARVEVLESCAAEAGSAPDALVLVFSFPRPDTFAAAQAACDNIDLDSVEVRLLVGTHADTLSPGGADAGNLELSERCEWLQQALDWSVEHGFELVCCAGTPEADAALTLHGDRQGSARVVEALHAHTWPGLTLKSPHADAARSPALPPAAAGGLSTSGRGGVDADAAAYARASGGVGASPAAAAARGAGASGSVEGEGLLAASRPVPPPPPAAHVQHSNEKEEEAEAVEAERTVDGLERLMVEMRGHKERLAGLSDAERREQAASLALRMLEALGPEQEGSESSDDV